MSRLVVGLFFDDLPSRSMDLSLVSTGTKLRPLSPHTSQTLLWPLVQDRKHRGELMSFKVVAWTLMAALAFAAILLFNSWAAFQPLSTLVYAGIALALCGVANLVVPFRFLGVRKRAVGALILASGVVLTFAALCWPASTVRVAQPGTRLDAIMPEYQFFERHSARIHARPKQAMAAVRASTFGDMKSLDTLLKIRAAALRIHDNANLLQDRRVVDTFATSGYLTESTEHEIVMFVASNPGTMRRPEVHTLREFADYHEPGAFKMAFNFLVEDAGDGWSTVSTETRLWALDDATRRGVGRYWRLIVPGSGLLRREWLSGIRKRAESMPNPQS